MKEIKGYENYKIGHLSECCNRKRGSCGNYHWRYATEEEIEHYYITNAR